MKRLLLLLLFLPALAGADERILSFHSDIRVLPNGMLEVTETIKVRAEGQQIRRGIYRDFPVDYRDRLGNDYHIQLEPLLVMRNESRESWHTARSGRDMRIYFGHRNRFRVFITSITLFRKDQQVSRRRLTTLERSSMVSSLPVLTR